MSYTDESVKSAIAAAIWTVESQLREQLAQQIETDTFYKSQEFDDRQVQIALACRIRYATMVRGQK